MHPQRVSFRAVLGIATCLMVSVPCSGQFASQAGIEVASIDANTRWGFRALSSVTVASSIVRLGDVVVPLDPNMAGWQRLSREVIGLVPVDGQPMKIDRDRLTRVIYSYEATPQTIDWVGPKSIVVQYDPKARPKPRISALNAAFEVPARQSVSPPPAPLMTDVEAKRVVQWVVRGINTFMPEILDDYSIDIDADQRELANLKSLAVITNMELLEPPAEGEVACRVSARGVSGPITATIDLTMTAHPEVVVARSSLQRGHRVEASDLEWQTIQRDRMKPEYVTDPTEVIGMEVRSSLAANRPIVRDRLGAPILIQRGDLIEVEVVGGGITVSTNAKALGSGSASDLIEIETLSPRKRLVGRVVQPGVVEIVTRAPNIRR